jgi:hypothetical protein
MASAQEMLDQQTNPFGEFGQQATSGALDGTGGGSGGGSGGGGGGWMDSAATIGAGFLGGGGGSLDMGSSADMTDRSFTDMSGGGITVNRQADGPAYPAMASQGPTAAGMLGGGAMGGGNAMAQALPWVALALAGVAAFKS